MPRGFPHGNVFRTFGGPEKRLRILRTLVQALIKHDRIETTFAKAAEAQKYMDRLIDIAKMGKTNQYCNDMLEFWTETDEYKQRLFDVILPRFEAHKNQYTRVAVLPPVAEPGLHTSGTRYAVLELKGNPLPPLPLRQKNPHTLQNVLIDAAKNEWLQSYDQLKEKLEENKFTLTDDEHLNRNNAMNS